MLDSLYFLGMLGGIAWLAWWATGGAAAAHPSPFDMREPPPAANPWRADLGAEDSPALASRWRARRGAPPQFSRRRGR